MGIDLTTIKDCGYHKRCAEAILDGADETTAAFDTIGEMLDELHLMMRTQLRAQGKEPGTVIEMGPDERRQA